MDSSAWLLRKHALAEENKSFWKTWDSIRTAQFVFEIFSFSETDLKIRDLFQFERRGISDYSSTLAVLIVNVQLDPKLEHCKNTVDTPRDNSTAEDR